MNQLERNMELLASKLSNRDKIKGPRVGDYLKYSDDKYTRFTYLHESTVQTGGLHGSYYLYPGGGLEYSGGLDPGVSLCDLVETTEIRPGQVWFFSNDEARAHNGVHFDIPCRVYTLREGADTSGIWH